MGTRLGGMAIGLLLACGLAGSAMAGIPEAGMVLYGQVRDGGGALVTEGELTLECIPQGGGDAIVLSTALEEIEGPGGPYSYRLVVPFETQVPYAPASGARLSITDEAAPFTRTLRVNGAGITAEHTIRLSLADRGTARRVDVCTGCPEEVRVLHSADTDGNYRLSLGEFLRLYELHSATPTHEYHSDPYSEDGYAPGPGPQEGLPHTADYDGGADWVISMPEVLRVIDLFASTSDHAYSPYPQGDDGFQKGSGELPLTTASGEPDVVTYAYVDAFGPVAVQDSVPVTVTVDAIKSVSPSALGVTVSLPEGWEYAGLAGPGPEMAPAPEATGLLEFAWSGAVALPADFTFNMKPVTAIGTEGHTVLAQATYRVPLGRDERHGLAGRLTIADAAPDGVEAPGGGGEEETLVVAVDLDTPGLEAPTWRPGGLLGSAGGEAGAGGTGSLVIGYLSGPGASGGGEDTEPADAGRRWAVVLPEDDADPVSDLSETPLVLDEDPSYRPGAMGAADGEQVPAHGPYTMVLLLAALAGLGAIWLRVRAAERRPL